MADEDVLELITEQMAKVRTYEFDPECFYSTLVEEERIPDGEVLYDEGRFLSFFDDFLDELWHSSFEDPATLCRMFDLLSLVRDPIIRAKATEGESREMTKAIREGMTESLHKRRKSKIFHFCPELDYQQVSNAIYNGDVELMQVFLKFGVTLSPTQSEATEKTSNSENKTTDHEKKLEEPKSVKPESAVLLQYHKCPYRVCTCPTYVLKKECRRTQLAAAAFSCASARKSRGRENRFKCFQLHFQAIPDPFITFDEIKNMIDAGKHERDNEYWEKTLGEFKKNNPEFNVPHQPRVLVHLCRCVIRTELKKKGCLPDLVKELEIPHTLKKCILIDSEGATY